MTSTAKLVDGDHNLVYQDGAHALGTLGAYPNCTQDHLSVPMSVNSGSYGVVVTINGASFSQGITVDD